MNENTEEVTQEQRKQALSTIVIDLRDGSSEVYKEVIAYQLLDAILIIVTSTDQITHMVPMDTTIHVTIKQNKE